MAAAGNDPPESAPHTRSELADDQVKRWREVIDGIRSVLSGERDQFTLEYPCHAPDKISARVYRGVPLFGRTEILIRDPQLSFDGRC